MRAMVDLAPQVAQVAQVAQRVQQAPMAVVETAVLVVRQAKLAMVAMVPQVMPAHLEAMVVRVVTQARMPGWVAPQVRLEWELEMWPVQARRELLAPLSLRVATEAMAEQVTPIHRAMAVTVVLVVRVAWWATEDLVGLVERLLPQARAPLRRVAKVVLVEPAAFQEMVVSEVLAVKPVQRAQMHRSQAAQAGMAEMALLLGPVV